MKTRRNPRLIIAVALALCTAVAAPIIAISHDGSPLAQGVPAAQWNAGMIITDAAFYNQNALNADQIQSFLNQKGSSCRAGDQPCLKDYTMSTPTMPADSYCGKYTGSSRETAAQIIAKVSVACGINPQVLLATLQKETSLVTRNAPSSGSYRTAMGYGCPDSSVCDAQFYGFFNQIYRAARQFQIYAAKPASFSFRAGKTNTIAYNPSPSCGSSSVYIQNQATASLYNYTPYQPNQAALNNLYGTGNSCSAYGNRNFWTFFSDWFGSTTDVGVSYSAHVAYVGWQPPVTNGATAGTTGRALRMEALTITLSNVPAGSGVTYVAHVASIGWQKPVSNGATAGSTGQALQAEAVQIALTGPAADKYDLWYRVHVQDWGWLGWTSNGKAAGTTARAMRMEAIQIVLRDKGSAAPGSTSNPFYGAAIPNFGVTTDNTKPTTPPTTPPVQPTTSPSATPTDQPTTPTPTQPTTPPTTSPSATPTAQPTTPSPTPSATPTVAPPTAPTGIVSPAVGVKSTPITIIVKNGLNVRKGPGTNYSVITAAPVQSKMTIVGRTACNVSSPWAYVEYGSYKGWVIVDFEYFSINSGGKTLGGC